MEFRLRNAGSRTSILLAAVLLSRSALAVGTFDLRLQVAAGDSVPGSQSSLVFHSILESYSNDRNQIAFSATVGLREPAGTPLDSRWGLFLKEDAGIKKILMEGDALPGGANLALSNPSVTPIFAINNSGSICIIDADRGVFLYRDGKLSALVPAGSLAPGSSQPLRSFGVFLSRRFFNQKDEVAFQAARSSTGFGLFLWTNSGLTKVAADGEIIPDRPGRKFSSVTFQYTTLLLSDSALLFSAPVETGPTRGLFLFSNSGTRTVAITGDPLPDGAGSIDEIGEFDANPQGQMTVTFRSGSRLPRSAFLYLSSGNLIAGAKLQRIAGGDISVPGLTVNSPSVYSNLSLDNQGRLFFAAQVIGQRAGFFLWDRGEIRKIVLDGEPTPVGGTFALGKTPMIIDLSPPPGEGYRFSFNVSRINDSRQVAFVSGINGSDAGDTPFIWRSGILEPVSKATASGGEIGDRLLQSLFSVSLNQQGSVFFIAGLCCDGFDTALYVAVPAAPRIQYLPLLASGGTQANLAYATVLQISNQSTLPGFVSLEAFDRDGNSFPFFFARDLLLNAGEVRTIFVPSNPRIISGYLRMRVEGGADVALNATIQLIRNYRIESQTGMSAAPLSSSAVVIAEINSRSNTGLAISNPNPRNNRVVFHLLDAQGQAVSDRELIFAPGQQVTLFVDQLFPDLHDDFIGLVRITGDAPFLAAGLRLSGLKLSTLPLDRDPQPAPFRLWGFANLLPTPPGQYFTLSLYQAFVNNRGHAVLLMTGSNEIRLLTPDRSVTVLNRDTVLPGTGCKPSTNFWPPLYILGFNDSDEILFFALLQDGSFGIFLWRGDTIQKVALSGEIQLSRSVVEYLTRPIAVLNNAGTIAILSDHGVFLYNGSLRRIAGGTAQFQSVDLNNSGLLAFASSTEIGVFDGRDIKYIAEAGDVAGHFRFGEFIRAKITDGGQVYFTAYGDTSRQGPTGFFLYDGSTVKPLVLSGDPVLGKPELVLRRLDNPGYSPFQVNRNNVAVLFNTFGKSSAPEGLFGSGLLIFENGQLRTLIDQGAANGLFSSRFSSSPFFRLNAANQLLFNSAVRQGGRVKRAFSIWEDGLVRTVLREGNKLFSSPDTPPALFQFLDTAWDFSDTGLFLFTCGVFGEGASGLYMSIPENFQTNFIPHVAQGNFSGIQYASTLLLRNKDNIPSSVSLSFFTTNGSSSTSGSPIALQPGEVKRISLSDSAGLNPEGTSASLPSGFVGWTLAGTAGGQTEIFERISVSDGSTLVSEVTVPPARPASVGLWSGTSTTAFDTGVALSNPYHVPIQVDLEVLGASLQLEDKTQVTLPELGQKAILLSELFPRRQSSSLPKVFRFRSSAPVPAITLRLDGLLITSLPISAPESNFSLINQRNARYAAPAAQPIGRKRRANGMQKPRSATGFRG